MMEYKDIYEELEHALWGENDGLLIKLRDPFHNYPGNLERSETLETIEIVNNFANKLALDTNDEYVIKIIDLICEFVGESHIQADASKVWGTEYDPEFMLSEFSMEDVKEPKPKKKYIVSKITKNIDTNEVIESNEEFFFFADAKKYMDDLTKNTREFDKSIFENGEDSIIAKDEERYFETKDGYIVKILEK